MEELVFPDSPTSSPKRFEQNHIYNSLKSEDYSKSTRKNSFIIRKMPYGSKVKVLSARCLVDPRYMRYHQVALPIQGTSIFLKGALQIQTDQRYKCYSQSALRTQESSDLLVTKQLHGKPDLRWATVDYLEALKLFNNDTIEYLRGLSEFAYNHQEVGYHIRNFIEEEVQNDPEGFDTFDKVQLKNDLSYLVFTDEISEKAVEKIDGNIMCSQNASYWATSILENWVMCDQLTFPISLNTSCLDIDSSDYLVVNDQVHDQDEPYMHKDGQGNWNVDKWFPHTYQSGQQGGQCGRVINIINVKEKEIRTNHFLNTDDKGRFKYFFHGTDWFSVEDIVRNRIRLNDTSSKYGQDFSYDQRPGFYVIDNFQPCKEWAERKSKPAVIVFRVPNEIFSEGFHLDLSSRRQDLTAVYAYNRSKGKIIPLDNMDHVIQECQRCKTITGPMLLNVRQFMDENEPQAVSGDKQTCILDDDVASQFHANIDCIVYYQKPTKRTTQRQRRPLR